LTFVPAFGEPQARCSWASVGRARTSSTTPALVIFNDVTGEVIKVAGPHTVLEGGNEPFCEALS
jgi:hypothetical protein